jgi:hypothetical protein
MRYVDVCSLYPYVLKYKPFPIGHLQIITSDFGDVNDYCRVFPSRGLYYLTRSAANYCFFHTCAEQRDLGPDDCCHHTDFQRSLTGIWVTSELQKALELGYRLDEIYEVWIFPESSHDLFASYINTFLKIKQQASGFPDDCQTTE